MATPLGLILRYLSEKERRKALASSKVKVLGKDVVASYKIISAAVIVPVAMNVYTILFWLLIRKVSFGKRNKWKLTLLFYLLWPFYIYLMIGTSDTLIKNAKTIKSKMLFLLFESKYRMLRESR
jgi:glycerol-3-phosphate O-acyltransferase/dihydroxyacetone phosphate acyltransferase